MSKVLKRKENVTYLNLQNKAAELAELQENTLAFMMLSIPPHMQVYYMRDLQQCQYISDLGRFTKRMELIKEQLYARHNRQTLHNMFSGSPFDINGNGGTHNI